jgi:membrane protein implicated in regulation of membrane protease activity
VQLVGALLFVAGACLFAASHPKICLTILGCAVVPLLVGFAAAVFTAIAIFAAWLIWRTVRPDNRIHPIYLPAHRARNHRRPSEEIIPAGRVVRPA